MSLSLIEELRANADAHPLDVRLGVMLEAADALESQAREIERLNAHCLRLGQGDAERYWEGRWREADAELAALKAKPRGMVLPERRGESDNPAELMFNRGHDHALAEVARLNSSPVSAPITATNDQIAAVMLLHGTPEQKVEAARYAGLPVASASAGGVDERAAFEVEIPNIAATYDGLYLTPMMPLKAGEHLMTVTQHLRIEKQLRAALSTPNHSEQVREVVLNPDWVMHMLSDRWPESSERVEVELFYEWLRDLLAAAPSAGSQKEQGE